VRCDNILTLTKGIRVTSIIITRMEGEGGTKIKDKEYEDIWCEVPKSKTYSECDILEEL